MRGGGSFNEFCYVTLKDDLLSLLERDNLPCVIAEWLLSEYGHVCLRKMAEKQNVAVRLYSYYVWIGGLRWKMRPVYVASIATGFNSLTGGQSHVLFGIHWAGICRYIFFRCIPHFCGSQRWQTSEISIGFVRQAILPIRDERTEPTKLSLGPNFQKSLVLCELFEVCCGTLWLNLRRLKMFG